MTLDEQKRHAEKLLFASASGDVPTVASLISEDFHFQYMERQKGWSGEGSTRSNRDNFLKIGVPMSNSLTKDGMHFTLLRVIGEADCVAIFGESNATSNDGKRYNNRYCWRITFSGDKVSEFLEFCDTHHAREILFDELPG